MFKFTGAQEQQGSSLSPSDRTQRLLKRKEQRLASAEAKRKTAEDLKTKGNECYRKGDFTEAVRYYEDAIVAYGPKTVYMSNLAAALLKVGKYEQAENAASVALRRDPKSLKARYRRALARQGQGCYAAALFDLEDVLAIDPQCQEAIQTKREIYAVGGQFQIAKEIKPGEERDPRPDEPPSPPYTPVPSDSEDYVHLGNGIPCRDYNHEGCDLGAKCKFKHAADNRSVRDDLGRNICFAYLFDLCKAPASSCPYAHDRSSLTSRYFNDPDWIKEICKGLDIMGAINSEETLERVAPVFKDPISSTLWVPRLRVEHCAEITQAMLDGYATTPWAEVGRALARANGEVEEHDDTDDESYEESSS